MNTCGSCTACCTVVPVSSFGKPAYQSCLHLLPPSLPWEKPRCGCGIYPTRPRECRVWQCAWLKDGLDPELRPDRLGIVIDCHPDLIEIGGVRVPAAQIWVLAGREAVIDDPRVRRLVIALIFDPKPIVRAVLFRTAGDRAISMSRHPTDDDDATVYVSPTVRMSAKKLGGAAERFIEAQRLIQGGADGRDGEKAGGC